MDRRDHTVRCAGLNLHVADWGDAGGWPVLMLHGIRSFADTFEGLAGALQPGYRVLALDHRGRGQSDWDPGRNYYTDAYVQDVRSVVEQLGLSRFDLLGHSMGGINAIVYAAAHPDRVRKLVVEDAGPGAFDDSDGARRIRAELSRTPESFADWSAAEAFMREIRPTVTPEAIAARLRHMLEPHGGRLRWRYDHAGIKAARLDPDPARVVDLWPPVQALRCPTLVLRGGRSDYLGVATAQAMAARNPAIAWREIPDAGHYVHDDQPERVARAVAEFLGAAPAP